MLDKVIALLGVEIDQIRGRNEGAFVEDKTLEVLLWFRKRLNRRFA